MALIGQYPINATENPFRPNAVQHSNMLSVIALLSIMDNSSRRPVKEVQALTQRARKIAVHFLVHFVTGLDGLGRNDSEGVSVGDGTFR